MERRMAQIAQGQATKEQVVNEIIQQMKLIFSEIAQKKDVFTSKVGEFISENERSSLETEVNQRE